MVDFKRGELICYRNKLGWDTSSQHLLTSNNILKVLTMAGAFGLLIFGSLRYIKSERRDYISADTDKNEGMV